jgi:hypothetical protein
MAVQWPLSPAIDFAAPSRYHPPPDVQDKNSNSQLHWGPKSQNAFPVKGTIGLIITVGLIFGVLASVPVARLWIYVSIPVGIMVALVLHFLRR